LNAQNRGFSEFFAILGYGVHSASEFPLKLLEIDKTTCVRNYTDAVARLMSISSDFLYTVAVKLFVLSDTGFTSSVTITNSYSAALTFAFRLASTLDSLYINSDMFQSS